MAFDLIATVRAVHVIASALWVGGAIFMSFIMGPHLRAAGPKAGPVMMTAMRRGGFGPFFGSMATVSILSGAYVYWQYGFHTLAFADASYVFLTLGVVLALVAYVDGLAVVLPTEAKLKALARSAPADGPPSGEMVAQFQALGAKQAKASAMAAVLLGLTLLSMTLYKVF